MNLIAWFLHLALVIVPPKTTPVTIDCSTIPPEAPPVASCWKPPVVVPKPPSTTVVTVRPPAVTTTIARTIPPARVTGCKIAAGTDVCVSAVQITENADAWTSSVRIERAGS